MTPPRIACHWPISLSMAFAAVWLVADCAHSQGPVSDQIRSVTIGDISVGLPPPSMPDGLDADGQASVLMTVAGKYPLDRFSRESIVAPFTLKRESIKNAEGERIGHRVDVWFVAHGRLSAIRERDLLTAMVEGSEDVGAGTKLSDAELTQRGISVPPVGDGEDGATPPAYYHFSVPVIDRVIVEGVVRGVSITSSESHFAGIMLEDTFRGDATYPNRWRHANQDAAASVDYAGCAAYAKATQLIGSEDAILVECHAVLHEPQAWFKGANLLGSKLPIAIQNSVRGFRRALSKQQ